ncbi:MAG: GlsB/YeaQ/YmgE family stress response membrane protein [Isosphaeraceae bacterium]
MDVVLFLLIGLAAGWLAGQIVKRPGSGWLEDLIVGVVGALIGGVVFRLLQIRAVGLLGSLISATLGAVILLLLLRRFRRI